MISALDRIVVKGSTANVRVIYLSICSLRKNRTVSKPTLKWQKDIHKEFDNLLNRDQISVFTGT